MEYVQMTISDWMEIKERIRKELNNQKHSFVRTGYYLRKVRDEKLYEQDGYKSLTEWAKEEFNLGASYVSRMISINEKFSIDGYSQQMDPRFEDYRQGALTEMLALPDSDLEMITPATSREDIRELKRFNSQTVDMQGDSTAKEVEDPEAKKHRELVEVVKEFCRQDRELTNELFSREFGNMENLIETINPSGSRTFKKGLYFVSFTDSVVKIKKFMQTPQDYSYQQFMEMVYEALGPETSMSKWEDCFGVAPAQMTEPEAKENAQKPEENARKTEKSVQNPEENAQKPKEGKENEETGNQRRTEEGSKRNQSAAAADDEDGKADQRNAGRVSDETHDILKTDRAAGSVTGGCHQNGERTQAEHDRSNQISAAPGGVGEGNLESAGQPAEKGWPEEWRPQAEQKAPEQEGFAPAQKETAGDRKDPFSEVRERIMSAAGNITAYVQKHNWPAIEGELIRIKDTLEDAKRIEDMFGEGKECL